MFGLKIFTIMAESLVYIGDDDIFQYVIQK
jgi:ABC-type glucose/galactose transport system permease subunit